MFRQHYEKMYNLARCILSDDDESKDVVSDVFTHILAYEGVKERVAKLLLADADVVLAEDMDER